jgi:hypothetical protein
MFFTDARSNRMVQNEALIREEMFRECTFRPKIKELPSSYGIGKSTKGEIVHNGSHSALVLLLVHCPLPSCQYDGTGWDGV